MPDPNWSDATRDDLHQDLAVALGDGGLGLAVERWCHPQNASWLLVCTDELVEANFDKTTWSITAGKIGIDTDVDGWTYFTFTDASGGAGHWKLDAYADSARTLKCATTGNVVDAAVGTFTAQSGYFFAGTVTNITTAQGTFNFRAQLIPPRVQNLERLFSGTQPSDGQLKARGQATGETMRAAGASIRQAGEGFAAAVIRSEIQPKLASVSSANQLLDPGFKSSSGTITQSPRGLEEDLRLAQQDNAGGSGAIKAGASTLSGSVSWDPTWTGKATGPSYGQRGVPAKLTFRCVKSLDTTPPQFEVTRVTTDPRRLPGDGTQGAELAQPREVTRLTLGLTWMNPAWGVESLVIDYAPTAANESGTAISATSTDWSVVGLKSTLSDAGRLWGIYDGVAIKWYDSQTARNAQDANHLVCQKTIGTGGVNTVFTTETADSGIAVTGKTGAGTTGALVNGDKFNVNFNAPSATLPAATPTLAITETTKGSRWVARMRDGGVGGVGYRPNTGSGPNLKDGWIEAGVPMIHPGVLGQKD